MIPRTDGPFFSKEVSTTNTMACPSCEQIVMASAPSCRHCGVPIDAQTAARANAEAQKLNTAIGQANLIKYTEWAAVLVVGMMLLIAFGSVSDRRLVTFWFGPPAAVAGVLNWFRRFGGLSATDPDYAEARRGVLRAGYVWGVALAVEVVLAAYAFFAAQS